MIISCQGRTTAPFFLNLLPRIIAAEFVKDMTSEVNLESVNNNVYLNSDTVSEKLNHCGECHANSSFGGSSNIMGSSADRDTASLDSGCDSSCTSGKSCSLELGEQFHAQDNAVDRIPRRRKIMNVDG